MSVTLAPSKVIVTTVPTEGVDVTVGTPGKPGTPGPPGPEGGTPVIAVEYDDWGPNGPANPQPNTLYLRLAP